MLWYNGDRQTGEAVCNIIHKRCLIRAIFGDSSHLYNKVTMLGACVKTAVSCELAMIAGRVQSYLKHVLSLLAVLLSSSSSFLNQGLLLPEQVLLVV